MNSIKPYALMVLLILGVATMAQQATEQQPTSKPLTNQDVVAMVQAGLDQGVIITKIRHSSVAFDCSTDGLVSLKKESVPTEVVKVMIERPEGAPPAEAAPAEQIPPLAAQAAAAKATSLKEVKTVEIRADSEVLRVTIEQELKQLGGPAVSVGSADANAVLSFATDCGAQTISMWSGANYCTCEGSLTVASAGTPFWTNMERERSANAAKASKKLAESMVRKFVADWRRAQGR